MKVVRLLSNITCWMPSHYREEKKKPGLLAGDVVSAARFCHGNLTWQMAQSNHFAAENQSP